MKISEENLVTIWRYFQFCCLPSIIMARYAYADYIDDIKKEKTFYRHKNKYEINRIGKYLSALPDKLMAVSKQNIRYMTIFGANVEEQFQDDEEELHRAIYISFKNAKMQHLDCLAALHYTSVMLQIASVVYSQCCKDLKKVMHVDPTDAFSTYNLNQITEMWNKIVDSASVCFGYDKKDKKTPSVDLNNPRCTKAVDVIRKKLDNINTLRVAMRESYPYSINYKEDIPYEQSADYLITHSREHSNNSTN